MMKTQTSQNNIPEGWQATKLIHIFEFKNGLNKEKKYFGHGTPIINYMDINRGHGLHKENILGRVEVNQSELARFDVKRGDVFFTRTSETLGEIGLSAVAIDDFRDTVFSGFVLRARPKAKMLMPEYSKYCFRAQSARKEIIEKSSYTTRALTSGALLNHVNINLPPLPEQKRIVGVLETWDQAIQKLSQMIEKKKNIKKGFIQELLTGKTRLRGSKGKWEILPLSKVAQINPRAEILPSKFVYIDLESVEKGRLLAERWTQIRNAPSRAQRLLKEGDVLFQTVRPYQMNNLYFNKAGDYVASTGYAQLRAYGDSHFLYYVLHTEKFVNDVLNRCTGSNYPAINSTNLAEIEIKVPTDFKEQSAIADTLAAADKEIQTLELKLKIFQEQKRYLLNNLITGTIRTPESLKINP